MLAMKRWYRDDVPDAAPKRRGGGGLLTMSLAVLAGATIALTADSHGDSQRTFVEVKESVSKTLQAFSLDPAQMSRIFMLTQGSAKIADPAPAVAIVIDDLGAS